MATIQKNDYLIYKNASGKLERIPVIIENMEITQGKEWGLSVVNPDTKELLGTVTCWKINNKLKFEGLISHVDGKGVGTKLILELINISKNLGADGILIAGASPSPGSQIKKPLTNIPFYYKLGFQAMNSDKHNAIKKLLDEKKDIPLGLNVFTDIELSKEAAAKLEQKATALQQAFEKQNTTNASQTEQFKKATDDLSEKIVLQTAKTKQHKQNKDNNR